MTLKATSKATGSSDSNPPVDATWEVTMFRNANEPDPIYRIPPRPYIPMVKVAVSYRY